MSAGLVRTAACIFCDQVPGQQKQEKSFDTDGHIVSISRWLLQIHLIKSIYGNFDLFVCVRVCVCLCSICLEGSSNLTHFRCGLFAYFVPHILHKLLWKVETFIFCVYISPPVYLRICCPSTNNDWEPSSGRGSSGNPVHPNKLAKYNNLSRPKTIWWSQSQVHEWTAQHPQWVGRISHSQRPLGRSGET